VRRALLIGAAAIVACVLIGRVAEPSAKVRDDNDRQAARR